MNRRDATLAGEMVLRGLLRRHLSFWSTRELATYAVDGPRFGDLADGLAHAALAAAVLTAGTLWTSSSRLRVHRKTV